MSLRPKDEDGLAETLLQNDRKFTRSFVRTFHKAWLSKYQRKGHKKEWLIDHVNKTLKNNFEKLFPRESSTQTEEEKPGRVSRASKNEAFAKHKRVYRSKNSIRNNALANKHALLARIPLVVYNDPTSFISDNRCMGFNLVESDVENYRKPVKRPIDRKKQAKKPKATFELSESDSDECSSEREYKAKTRQMSKREGMKKVSSDQFKKEFREYLRKIRGVEAYDFPNLGKLTLVEADSEEAEEARANESSSVARSRQDSVALALQRRKAALESLFQTKHSQRAARAQSRVQRHSGEGHGGLVQQKLQKKSAGLKKAVTKADSHAVAELKAEIVAILQNKKGRPRKSEESKKTQKRASDSKPPTKKAGVEAAPVRDKLEKIRESVSKRLYAEDQIEDSKAIPKKASANLLGKRQSLSPIPDLKQQTSARKVVVDATKTTAASNKKVSLIKAQLESPRFVKPLNKEPLEGQRLFLEDFTNGNQLQTKKKSVGEKVSLEESAYKLEQITAKKGDEGGLLIKESLSKLFDRLGNDIQLKASIDKGKLSIREKENIHNEIKKSGVLTEKSQKVIENIIKNSISKSVKKSEVKEPPISNDKLTSIMNLPEATVRFEELIKPQGQLVLPAAYKRLLTKFEKLDDVMNFMNMKQTPTYLGIVCKAFSSSFNE